MNRFRQEMSVIPLAAWIIGVAGYGCLAVVLLRKAYAPLAFGLLVPLVIIVYALLAGYVYADAKRRGMRYVMWTLLVLLIPNAIGFILYFIMREPLIVRCPHCGGAVRQGFAFCAHCGAALSPSCPQCRRAVESGWQHCPYCATALTPAPLGSGR